jgi:hypothetical protein
VGAWKGGVGAWVRAWCVGARVGGVCVRALGVRIASVSLRLLLNHCCYIAAFVVEPLLLPARAITPEKNHCGLVGAACCPAFFLASGVEAPMYLSRKKLKKHKTHIM